tara:strand:+ start:2849 stop:3265 length:417 start_codon:yes stop_codon:yes gene_type:complete
MQVNKEKVNSIIKNINTKIILIETLNNSKQDFLKYDNYNYDENNEKNCEHEDFDSISPRSKNKIKDLIKYNINFLENLINKKNKDKFDDQLINHEIYCDIPICLRELVSLGIINSLDAIKMYEEEILLNISHNIIQCN